MTATSAWGARHVVFLDLYGQAVRLSDDEAFHLVMKAAAGELEIEEIAAHLAVQ